MEIIFLALIVLVVFIVANKKTTAKNSTAIKYQKTPALFTPAERSFLGVLDAAIGDQYRIMGKVRVADVLEPQRGLSRKNWQISFNRISAKHFDYLLCDPKTLEIKAALELDDSSHSSKDRMKRDNFLEAACESAGFKLIRVKAQKSYQTQQIKDAINANFNQEMAKPQRHHQPKQRKEPTLQAARKVEQVLE